MYFNLIWNGLQILNQNLESSLGRSGFCFMVALVHDCKFNKKII
jgi:hypothetical protein